ncbi:heparan-alpha-glucosaminide N-acetyltransferase [Bacteriovoracaceae bacterium]|nr:heparan-alpha-glucosaminide N-acetyltransferase [Bacteriovoracaceae bacterium]
MNSNVKRFHVIDFLRGFAVLLMIIFHFSYDLDFFGYIEVDFIKDTFWWVFPRVIVFFFLLTVGASSALVHKEKIRWDKFSPRFLKLVLFALIISISTYFIFPNNWIYFGTLHCIASVSLCLLPFVKKPKLSFLLFLIFLIPPVFFGFKWPFWNMAHASMDYIPLLPWVGIGLLGISYKHFLLEKSEQLYLSVNLPGKSFVTYLGIHSLIIYLIHQPILFGTVKLYSLIVK